MTLWSFAWITKKTIFSARAKVPFLEYLDILQSEVILTMDLFELEEDKSSTQARSSDANSEVVDSETPSTSQPVMTERQVAKRKLHIKKLENALKACGREIGRIEEADMCLDDLYDENSAYLKLSKYKARYMKIYKKYSIFYVN